jgi:Transposase, Mutator family
MRDWAAELVERARSEGVELTGDNGLLTTLVRQVLQTGLEVEMTDHLGYERHDPAGRGSGNSRNGSHPKTVTTDIGTVQLRVPCATGAASPTNRQHSKCSIWWRPKGGKPSQPRRADQRLETHPERTHLPLRRPHPGRHLTMQPSRPPTHGIGQSHYVGSMAVEVLAAAVRRSWSSEGRRGGQRSVRPGAGLRRRERPYERRSEHVRVNAAETRTRPDASP